MGYVIQSGKYETGTEEQQIAFRQLFGENSLYCFDMYFHWYNLIHELGHCFINQSNLRKKSELEQEMFANEFAVGYYEDVSIPDEPPAVPDAKTDEKTDHKK